MQPSRRTPRGGRREAPILSPHRVLEGWRRERGVTGLEWGITLGAFVLVGAAISGVVMQTGLLTSDELGQTARAALRSTSGGIELRGPVVAHTDGQYVTELTLDVRTGTGAAPMSLDWTAPSARTVVSYIDEQVVVNDVPYRVDWILGDGDALLETGELAQIIADVRGVAPPMGNGRTFAVQVRPPEGAPFTARRTLPQGAGLDPVVNLW